MRGPHLNQKSACTLPSARPAPSRGHHGPGSLAQGRGPRAEAESPWPSGSTARGESGPPTPSPRGPSPAPLRLTRRRHSPHRGTRHTVEGGHPLSTIRVRGPRPRAGRQATWRPPRCGRCGHRTGRGRRIRRSRRSGCGGAPPPPESSIILFPSLGTSGVVRGTPRETGLLRSGPGLPRLRPGGAAAVGEGLRPGRLTSSIGCDPAGETGGKAQGRQTGWSDGPVRPVHGQALL